MPETPNAVQPRPPLPTEIREALKQIDTERLFNELSEGGILSPAELLTMRKELLLLLKGLWYDRNATPNALFTSTVPPERRQAAMWKLEELVLSPLAESLRGAGLGSDEVLFEKGKFALAAGRVEGHITDRVTIKSQNVVLRKRFLRKSTTVTEMVLDVDYPERGRYGEYEILQVDLEEGEVARFREALVKASMVGCFNAFLGRMREMV